MTRSYVNAMLIAVLAINVNTTTAKVCKADIALIVDRSGSICEDQQITDGACENWRLILKYLVGICIRLDVSPDRVRVALVVYGTTARVVFHLSRYHNVDELVGVLHDLPYGPRSGTNTAAGISTALNEVFVEAHGDRPDVFDLIIVLTDGMSNVDSDRTIPVAEEAWTTRNISIIAIGVTDKVNVDEVAAISRPPHVEGEDYYLVNTFYNISLLREDLLLYSACNETIVPHIEPPPMPQAAFGLASSNMVAVGLPLAWFAYTVL